MLRDEWQPEAWIGLRRLAWSRLAKLFFCLLLLPLLASLSDCSPIDLLAAYEHAKQTFNHGHLEAARSEADRGYRQSLTQDPGLAKRFQILEARALAWSGFNKETLELLAQGPVCAAAAIHCRPDDEIEQKVLETEAMLNLGRVADAEQILSQADRLCSQSRSQRCGDLVQAHGLDSIINGHIEQARQTYLHALELARVNNDQMFEATVLTNLSWTLSLQDRHDEALSFARESYRIAKQAGAEDLASNALGNEGWEFYTVGNPEKALEAYTMAQQGAASLGDRDNEAQFLTVAALAYVDLGQLKSAESFDLRAINLAHEINSESKVTNASEDLAQVYLYQGRIEDAEDYAGKAESLARKSGSVLDVLDCHMLQGQAAAARHDWPRADSLLHEVALAPESQNRMRWTAQHTLASMYEAQGNMAAAEQSYKAAIALVEGARANLHQELSQLTFLNNASSIYDDYIHFLVAQGRTNEALEAADWSRARTLQQGLGIISSNASPKVPGLNAQAIARSTNTALLFYWMGEKQSYLWAVTPETTTLMTLPARSEIVTRIERYRRTLLAVKDPLRANRGQGDKDGRDLFDMLVAPASGSLAPGRPVVLFTDGELTQLNFETLLAGTSTPHYWIEEATISSAPSIRLFATKSKVPASTQEKLLLIGDSVSPDPAYPGLPSAPLEMNKVRANFGPSAQSVFAGAEATPRAYMSARPEQFAYIHFVAHATAITTDPLESAVILSRGNGGEDSYKLYARDILQHPISARLVTISACNSSGNKFYAGEGIVGLSWAFLRAGAHNTVGALWDVSDESTPDLMDHLYAGLERGDQPANALREAKLYLLHSNGTFSRPFYWAPFQLYSGR